MVLGLWRNHCQALLSKESIRGDRNGKTTVGPTGFFLFQMYFVIFKFSTQLFISSFKIFYLKFNPDQSSSQCRSWSLPGERVKCERQGILIRYHCILFITRHYWIYYQVLLHLSPGITVFLYVYRYYFSCIYQLDYKSNLFQSNGESMIDKNGNVWTCIVCGKIAADAKTKVR